MSLLSNHHHCWTRNGSISLPHQDVQWKYILGKSCSAVVHFNREGHSLIFQNNSLFQQSEVHEISYLSTIIPQLLYKACFLGTCNLIGCLQEGLLKCHKSKRPQGSAMTKSFPCRLQGVKVMSRSCIIMLLKCLDSFSGLRLAFEGNELHGTHCGQ
jgi:hypothetical protein